VDAEVQLREATGEDEPFLWRMLALAAHVPASGDVRRDAARDPALAAYVRGWRDDPRDIGFVATVDGEPVGAAWARWWSERRSGYLFGKAPDLPELAIGVAPTHRGRGIGGLLLRALQDASPAGLILSVRLGNPAIHLYERHGFVELPEKRIRNRAGTISIVMRWQPPPA
jgi:ribosomal protein S18 acetylase RimI-like enzyme